MKKSFSLGALLAALAIWVSSAQAAINIDEAIIENGQVFVAGDKAPKQETINWEGIDVGTTNKGGGFTFTTTNLPADCVGRLTIGTDSRDVVIENCEPTTAGVPKTGQTTSYAAGDDGALQKGVEWPNPRFTDNLNGTVTDNLTGLIWLKNANGPGVTTIWQGALDFVAGITSGTCGLTDGSVAGDWRLPNVRELASLVDYGRWSPALPLNHPFTNFQSSYWSSTTRASFTLLAWCVDFGNGDVSNGSKTFNNCYVLAMRGGS